MSEPDSTPRRRPPTIDLTATEVDKPSAGADAQPNEPAPPNAAAANPPTRPGSPIVTAVAAGLAGAVAVAAILAGLWYGGYLPPRETPAPAVAQAPDSKAIADITARLSKVEGAVAAPRPAPPAQPAPVQQTDPALIARLASAEAAAKSLSDTLAALTHRVDDATAAAQNALSQAKSAATAADAAKNTAQADVTRGDLDALGARIAALESAMKALADNVKQQTASADDRAARSTIAAAALLAAVERGAPYQAELAAVKSLGAAASATAALDPFAATGVPRPMTLARELANLMPAVRQAAVPASGNSSYLERLEANARRLVQITPVDAPPGDDPESVLTRIEVEAERADIAAALADIAKLPDAAKTVAAPWVQKAQARNAAIAASRKLSADALASLGKPGPQ
jgi:hypothetical protein